MVILIKLFFELVVVTTIYEVAHLDRIAAGIHGMMSMCDVK